MSLESQFLRITDGGGGGLKQKYQEFNISGTFTPTQALLDAGGVVHIFIVGGGGASSVQGAAGGEVLIKYTKLSTLTGCVVTIGSGGTGQSNGGNSVFTGSSAGGDNITALGGLGFNSEQKVRLGAGWNADGSVGFGAGSGTLGFGAGGGISGGIGGISSAKANSGQGGGQGGAGGSGYCLITWQE